MSTGRLNNISISDAKIIFRNFRGEGDKYNPVGSRNFGVLLDQEAAASLAEDGWNVKYLKPREEGEEPQAWLPVAVEFKNFPPKIYLISRNKKTQLDEEAVGALDYSEIANIDIVIRPYEWEVGDKTGVKAYVKNMYVTVVEDEFAAKYDDLDD